MVANCDQTTMARSPAHTVLSLRGASVITVSPEVQQIALFSQPAGSATIAEESISNRLCALLISYRL